MSQPLRGTCKRVWLFRQAKTHSMIFSPRLPLDAAPGRPDPSARRERKTNFTEEVLADRQLAAGRRKRYNKLQDEANRHNRVKRRKTSMPREQQPKRKPKH